MADSINQLRSSFVEETRDLINELEDVLLSLKSDSVDNETIDQIFRSVHTIKGSGGMLGFEKVLAVTHDLEDIYDKVRSGTTKFSSTLKELSLETIDVLKTLINKDEKIDEAENIQFVNLCRKIKKFDEEIGGSKKAIISLEQEEENDPETFLIEIEPDGTLPSELSHPKFLVKELSLLGTSITFCRSGKQFLKNEFEKVNKTSHWLVFLSATSGVEAIEDIFGWVEEGIRTKITSICQGDLLAIKEAKEEISALGEDIMDAPEKQIKPLFEKYKKQLKSKKKTNKENTEEKKQDAQTSGKVITSIRVATEKVDQLMNLVSEMVTLQARLNLLSEQIDNEELTAVAEKYASFSKQLRDNTFTISLVPFGITITRYKRMVHDLSEQLNKKIIFNTEGEDTVLDKKIIEQLSDPIMHLLRNSIDHGIEDSETRLKENKSEEGNITMKIYHQSNSVIIKIIDDGRGIDLERIREIGIEKKLLTPDQNLSNSELTSLIFLPGFSSAKSVSNVSGRGVGLDVVKRNISEIRGSIEVNTQKGEGTEITIKLPLTLSIIDGLQVEIENRDFIIPLFQVDRIITLTELKQESELSQVIEIDGLQVPYFDLRSDFGISGKIPERREIVLLRYDSERVALIVDRVVGENQTVLKPLGKHYKEQDFISGGTILGDGSVALVLDINKIVTEFSKK